MQTWTKLLKTMVDNETSQKKLKDFEIITNIKTEVMILRDRKRNRGSQANNELKFALARMTEIKFS